MKTILSRTWDRIETAGLFEIHRVSIVKGEYYEDNLFDVGMLAGDITQNIIINLFGEPEYNYTDLLDFINTKT